MKTYLLRHTAVGIADGTCYGRSNVSLRNEATADINDVVKRLGSLQADTLVYSSPANRCTQLADALANDVSIDERLVEFNFGAWEGQLWSQIPKHEIDTWAADLGNARPPGGENLREVHTRVTALFTELYQRHADGCVVLVTHGGVIRTLVAHFLNMPLTNAVSLNVEFGGISLTRTNKFATQLMYLNR